MNSNPEGLATIERFLSLPGARHATHTFNAMRPLRHRDPGILGAVLTDSNLSADIIADGLHVDPAIVQLFLRAKGQDRAVFEVELDPKDFPKNATDLVTVDFTDIDGPQPKPYAPYTNGVLTFY